MSMLFPPLLGARDLETSSTYSMTVQYFIVNPLFIIIYVHVYLSQRKHLQFLRRVLLKEEQTSLIREQIAQLKAADRSVLLFFAYIIQVLALETCYKATGIAYVDTLWPQESQRYVYSFEIATAISDAIMLIGVASTLSGCLKEQEELRQSY